jgi:hypothetical protein
LPRSVLPAHLRNDRDERELASEPPPPVDPFDDGDDGDDDDDGVDNAAADERGSPSPVTFWLRGGRMRVPVAAAAIARADRRLSRLARKRGRRL